MPTFGSRSFQRLALFTIAGGPCAWWPSPPWVAGGFKFTNLERAYGYSKGDFGTRFRSSSKSDIMESNLKDRRKSLQEVQLRSGNFKSLFYT